MVGILVDFGFLNELVVEINEGFFFRIVKGMFKIYENFCFDLKILLSLDVVLIFV